MIPSSGDVGPKFSVGKGHGEHAPAEKKKSEKKSEWRGKSVYIKTSGEKGDGKTSFKSANEKPSFIKHIFQNKAERQAEKLAELKAMAQDLKISLLTKKELRSFGEQGKGGSALELAAGLYQTFLRLGKLDKSLEKEGETLKIELDRIMDRLNSPFLYNINEIKKLLAEAKTEKDLSNLGEELKKFKERLKGEYKKIDDYIPGPGEEKLDRVEIERMKKSVNGTIRSIEKTIIRKKAELTHDVAELSTGFELLIKNLKEAASFKQINNVRLGLSDLTVKLGKLESKGVDVKSVKAELENVSKSINKQDRLIRHHADNPKDGYRRTVLKEHESVRIPNKTSEREGIGMLNLDEQAGLNELRDLIRNGLKKGLDFLRRLNHEVMDMLDGGAPVGEAPEDIPVGREIPIEQLTKEQLIDARGKMAGGLKSNLNRFIALDKFKQPFSAQEYKAIEDHIIKLGDQSSYQELSQVRNMIRKGVLAKEIATGEHRQPLAFKDAGLQKEWGQIRQFYERIAEVDAAIEKKNVSEKVGASQVAEAEKAVPRSPEKVFKNLPAAFIALGKAVEKEGKKKDFGFTPNLMGRYKEKADNENAANTFLTQIESKREQLSEHTQSLLRQVRDLYTQTYGK